MALKRFVLGNNDWAPSLLSLSQAKRSDHGTSCGCLVDRWQWWTSQKVDFLWKLDTLGNKVLNDWPLTTRQGPEDFTIAQKHVGRLPPHTGQHRRDLPIQWPDQGQNFCVRVFSIPESQALITFCDPPKEFCVCSYLCQDHREFILYRGTDM